jgi:hypothetical protein
MNSYTPLTILVIMKNQVADGEVDEVYQDDQLPCSFNIDLGSALISLLSDANDVAVPE